MSKIYCDLDLKSPGCYGFRPLLDFSDTYYAKVILSFFLSFYSSTHGLFSLFLLFTTIFFFLLQQHQILDNESDSLLVDHNFMDKLDSVSNCKLSDVLKTSIRKIVKNRCLNCGLTLNLDVTAISSLSENLISTFSKLLNHAFTKKNWYWISWTLLHTSLLIAPFH
jgi:hypothetical protein